MSSASFENIWSAGFTLSGTWFQTEYVTRASPARVTITRRHHPAEGKSFDVVAGGQKQLVIRLDDESTMRIPRSWTDADGCGVGMDGPERVFSAGAIRELGALVALLAHRQSQESSGAALNVDRASHPASDEEV